LSEWKFIPIGDVIDLIQTGSTPSTSHPEYFKGSIPWFTPSDIGISPLLVNSERRLTDLGLQKGKAKLFSKGMILITCIGNIGRVGIIQQASSANQQITALKFKDSINIEYAYYWFIAHQPMLEKMQITQLCQF
jgi:type I restriction enzyme, S subunit